MSDKSDPTAAHYLRAAGYVPLPRLWVKPEELSLIRDMALKHGPDVNRIRSKAHVQDEIDRYQSNDEPEWKTYRAHHQEEW